MGGDFECSGKGDAKGHGQRGGGGGAQGGGWGQRGAVGEGFECSGEGGGAFQGSFLSGWWSRKHVAGSLTRARTWQGKEAFINPPLSAFDEHGPCSSSAIWPHIFAWRPDQDAKPAAAGWTQRGEWQHHLLFLWVDPYHSGFPNPGQ